MKRPFSQDENSGREAKRVRSEGDENSRTIYLGGVSENTSISEILDQVEGGIIDNIRLLQRKNCAFVTFFEPESAHIFFERATQNPPLIQGRKVTIGWGNSEPVSPHIAHAVSNGGTRNVFVGGSVDQRTTEVWFRRAFGRFGDIDCVDVLPNKRIAFVHFSSIDSAVKCIMTLGQDPQWQPFRLGYGKDRCVAGRKSRSNQRTPYPNQPMAHPGTFGFGNNAFGMGGSNFPPSGGFGERPPTGFGARGMYGSSGAMGGDVRFAAGFGQPTPSMGPMNYGASMFGVPSPQANFGNRTIYLGAFTEELTVRDLCDTIRGGLVDNVKTLPEKKCAFVTFIDPRVASMFYQRSQLSNGEFEVKGKRLKVGWGKSRPLSSDMMEAISRGATRNAFLGNIDETITEERLSEDLGQFGIIEKINVLAAKKIAFINFTSIADAITCVSALRSEDSHLHAAGYGSFRANYGKDRCAGDPRRSGYSARPMPVTRQHYQSNYPNAFQPGCAMPMNSGRHHPGGHHPGGHHSGGHHPGGHHPGGHHPGGQMM